MVESFRLINRHGMKIWISALFGGTTVAILLLIPHLFMALLLQSEWSSLMAQGKTWLDSAGSWREMAAEVFRNVQNGGITLLSYGVLVSLFTLLSFSFFVSGLMGVVRQAAVEQQVSLGHFFSFGFHYVFRMLTLVVLQMGSIALLLAGCWVAWSLVPGEWYWQAAFATAGLTLFLVLTAAFCHMAVVMFAEEMGVFRSFGYGFIAVFRRFGSTLASLLGSWFAGIGGATLLTFLSVFPWLVLQFFDDRAITLIVGVIFGSLLAIMLGTFPSILALAVLFQRYLTHIQDDLFPEDDIEPLLLQPFTDEEEIAAAQEPFDYRR
ncbi:hypothetical protein [Desmospora profundinema]|uniref:Uncharacterized protein n=1 Tax=Desmospora profundinema TaxID=1571184 RepID=A0ABU1IQ16_9BACL|nr:hypothetical protein [Desmospora profundinema]MDR6226503.1 hypothetical protein [Desmospora profundinema]